MDRWDEPLSSLLDQTSTVHALFSKGCAQHSKLMHIASVATSSVLDVQDPAQRNTWANQVATEASDMRIFRFLAQTKGATSLQFTLVRSWQPDAPRETFHLHVEVT